MTRQEFDMFLLGAGWVCFVMAAFNLLSFKRRGASAFVLAGALALFGVGALLYRAGVEQWLLATLGVCVFVLLVADFAIRSAHGESR